MRVHDASGTALADGERVDGLALARSEARVVRLQEDTLVGRVDREELIGRYPLLVHAARGEQQPAPVCGATDAATGAGHPVLGIKHAKQFDEEFPGRLFALAHAASVA